MEHGTRPCQASVRGATCLGQSLRGIWQRRVRGYSLKWCMQHCPALPFIRFYTMCPGRLLPIPNWCVANACSRLAPAAASTVLWPPKWGHQRCVRVLDVWWRIQGGGGGVGSVSHALLGLRNISAALILPGGVDGRGAACAAEPGPVCGHEYGPTERARGWSSGVIRAAGHLGLHGVDGTWSHALRFSLSLTLSLSWEPRVRNSPIFQGCTV